MNKHNHSHCLHDLKYCDHCDVVYCTKCDREWGGHNHWTWYYGGTPYRVTWTNTEYALYDNNTNLRVTNPQIISAYNSQPHTKEVEGTDFVGASTFCTHHN